MNVTETGSEYRQDVYKRQVHAIVGENGAGKSTFIKVITGAIAPTQGTLIFEGKQIEDNTPQKSMALGITAIYQELNLLKHLSVAENIYYNRYRKKSCLLYTSLVF